MQNRGALEALNRVQDAVRPTQTRIDPDGSAHRPGTGRLLGAGGRYEHRALRLCTLDPTDLATLAAAAASLGHALAARPGSELAEALAVGAESAAPARGPAPPPAALVEVLGRALGLFDLVDTDDTAVLRDRLAGAGDTAPMSCLPWMRTPPPAGSPAG